MSEELGIVAKLVTLATVIVVLLVAVLISMLIAVVYFSIQSRDQSEQNQRHIDCIVASASPRPPNYCVPVIEELIANGILRPTTTTPVPSIP